MGNQIFEAGKTAIWGGCGEVRKHCYTYNFTVAPSVSYCNELEIQNQVRCKLHTMIMFLSQNSIGQRDSLST